ncbi:hypothetical protein A9Q99_22415 [Gammaproteobacteria bacterium 45_16_T64]|nr:hypothetical protein A9Q99_22415 [Gammaproteobacteria bacterium 45_16_T64]
MIEAIIGVLLALFTITISRRQHWEHWSYTACLLSLPLIYMFFGLFAAESNVILTEFVFGIPYFVAGILCINYGFKFSGYIVATLWISHGIYDLLHPMLFVNSGVPAWYPILCAAVDIIVGIYLFSTIILSQKSNIKELGHQK